MSAVTPSGSVATAADGGRIRSRKSSSVYAARQPKITALKQYLDSSRLAVAAGAAPAADEWRTRLAGHVDARLADLARQ